MKKTKIVDTLKIIYDRLKDENIKWVLVGSASLFLQGVDIIANDIDILTDNDGAKRISYLFSEFIVKPVKYSEGEYFRSYFGEMKINKIKVEIMGDLEEKRKGIWISYKSRLENPVIISIGNINVPVSDLKEQLIGYKESSREKDRNRVKKIEEKLSQLENH